MKYMSLYKKIAANSVRISLSGISRRADRKDTSPFLWSQVVLWIASLIDRLPQINRPDENLVVGHTIDIPKVSLREQSETRAE